MLHKLLVLVLCLLVLAPQRFCTCAVASAPCSDPTCAPRPPSQPTDNRCDCHDHEDEGTTDVDDLVGDQSPVQPHRHPDRHDENCPAVKPAPDQKTSESVSFEHSTPVSLAIADATSSDGYPANRSTSPILTGPPGQLPVYLSTLRLRI